MADNPQREMTREELIAQCNILRERVKVLEGVLHGLEKCPGYEYTVTETPRKSACSERPDGERWEENLNRGREGWERFDHHEEEYWMRLKEPTDG